METYKSWRIIDGKLILVIVDKDENIVNRVPNKDELKGLKYEIYNARHIKHNETNTCDRCGTYLLIGGNPHREYEKGEDTGKWLCNKCYCSDSYKIVAKSVSGRRTGFINQNCTSGKGDIFEEITCVARIIDNLNYENDNFNSQIDHSRDSEYGILQTKGSSLLNYRGRQYWGFCTRGIVNMCIRDDNKIFDNVILYCMDKEMKNVLRVYIIPYEEVSVRTKINININSSKNSWYEKYRVDYKLYNDVYHKILLKKSRKTSI